MKRICLLTGSPRTGGSSDTVAGLIADRLVASGFHVQTLHTRDVVIRPCISCGYCDTHPGQCPLDGTPGITPHGRSGNDATRELFQTLADADSVIFTLPVYFYGPPAHLKALIDRTQRFWMLQALSKTTAPSENTIIPDQASVSMTSAVSRFARPIRPAFTVMCAARTQGKRLFDANVLILRCFLNALGFSFEEPLLLRGIEQPEDLFQTDEHLSYIHLYINDLLKKMSGYV